MLGRSIEKKTPGAGHRVLALENVDDKVKELETNCGRAVAGLQISFTGVSVAKDS